MKHEVHAVLYLTKGFTGGVGDEAYRDWERVDIEFNGIIVSLEDYFKNVLPALKRATYEHSIGVRLTIESEDG